MDVFLMLNNNNNDDIKKIVIFYGKFPSLISNITLLIIDKVSWQNFFGNISHCFPFNDSMIIIGEKYEYTIINSNFRFVDRWRFLHKRFSSSFKHKVIVWLFIHPKMIYSANLSQCLCTYESFVLTIVAVTLFQSQYNNQTPPFTGTFPQPSSRQS